MAPGEEPPPIEFSGAIKKGVHKLDVYVITTPKFSPGFEVLGDTEEPPYMATLPAAMFDPEQSPEIAEGLEDWAGTVTPAEDGGAFDVGFGEGTRGRALRLVLHDFETDAPAINSLKLTSSEDEVLLPTKADLLALRRNQTLEIVPGDTITLSYQDTTGVARNKEVHEARLSATYANGTISAGLVVGYQVDGSGLRRPQLAQIYRFQAGDTIDVTIRDADADSSDGEDESPSPCRLLERSR